MAVRVSIAADDAKKFVATRFVTVAFPSVALPRTATVAAKFVLVADVKTPFVAVKSNAAILLEVTLTASKFCTEPCEPFKLVAKKLVDVPLMTYKSVPVAFVQIRFEKLRGFVTTRLEKVPVVAEICDAVIDPPTTSPPLID